MPPSPLQPPRPPANATPCRPGRRWAGLAAAGLAGALACGSAPALEDNGLPIQSEAAHARSVAVAQTVVGILSYARWPREPDRVRLCVIGPTEYADELLRTGHAQVSVSYGRRLAVQRLRQDDLRVATECDAVYAGALSHGEWRALAQRLAGQPVLSISERSDLCTAIGMFCLDVRPASVSFEVNLDSVARSGVRIHPRVLNLARRRSLP